jgi:hypothetical protein
MLMDVKDPISAFQPGKQAAQSPDILPELHAGSTQDKDVLCVQGDIGTSSLDKCFAISLQPGSE